jgi:hypothetical protein
VDFVAQLLDDETERRMVAVGVNSQLGEKAIADDSDGSSAVVD